MLILTLILIRIVPESRAWRHRDKKHGTDDSECRGLQTGWAFHLASHEQALIYQNGCSTDLIMSYASPPPSLDLVLLKSYSASVEVSGPWPHGAMGLNTTFCKPQFRIVQIWQAKYYPQSKLKLRLKRPCKLSQRCMLTISSNWSCWLQTYVVDIYFTNDAVTCP